MIIVGWTSMDRYELPNANGDRLRLGPHITLAEEFDCDVDLHKRWYLDHHNAWLSFSDWIDDILYLQLACQQANKRLFMFNAVSSNNLPDFTELSTYNIWHVNNKGPWRLEADLQELRHRVDRVLQCDWLLAPEISLIDFCRQQGLDTDQWGHPMMPAQPVIANHFERTIKDLI